MSGETSVTNRSDEWGWSVRLHLMSPHITTHILWKRYNILHLQHITNKWRHTSPLIFHIPWTKISNMTFHIPWKTPIQISHIATHHHTFYIYNTSPPNFATHQHPYSIFHEKDITPHHTDIATYQHTLYTIPPYIMLPHITTSSSHKHF